MSKIVNDTHIIGERGVIRFHDYCNSHFPYLCFREITRNDFGIDGEVELVRINEDNKKEMTGELLKVQIKSSFGSGYIKRRRDGSFSFNAKQDDLEYWSKYSLGVILIVYDDETKNLYAKKIIQADYLGAKKKSYPIDFTEENILVNGSNDFSERFSSNFKSRVNFDTSEVLISNILNIKGHPKKLFVYASKYTTKDKIYDQIEENEAPHFAMNSDSVISLYDLKKNYKSFCSTILVNQTPQILSWNEILKDAVYKRKYNEVLNIILKDFLSPKRIWFHKKYKRFYFAKLKEENERLIESKSRKTGKINPEKKVVSEHSYGKDHFYRHLAFEFEYLYNYDELFLLINPKYLFTTDGKNTLEPKKITKYTNYLTAREYNDQVLDQLHLITTFLQNDEHSINILNTSDLKISLSLFISQNVKFGIPFDIPQERKKVAKESINNQTELFN